MNSNYNIDYNDCDSDKSTMSISYESEQDLFEEVEFQDEMVQLTNLIKEKEFDIVITAIECNVSIEFLDILLSRLKYNINKFTVFKNGEIKSPLYAAISKNHFKIADFIISKGGDVNYVQNNFNIAKLLMENNLFTTKVFMYLLNRDWDIMMIKHYVYNFNFRYDLASTYIKYLCDKDLVNQLLSMYQKKDGISKENFDKIVMCERSFDIPYQWYYRCIYQNTYDQFKFFSCYDSRKSLKSKIEYIIKNFDEAEHPGFSTKLYEFFIQYKYNNNNICLNYKLMLDNNQVKRCMDKIINEKRNKLNNIIKECDIEKLICFYQDNDALMDNINDSNYDVLSNAISFGLPLNFIESIINLFSYSNFDYEVPKNIFAETITPAVYSLLLSRSDVCSLLISNGADINYRFIDSTNSFNILIDFLIFHRKASFDVLYYIIEKLKNESKKIEKLRIPEYVFHIIIKHKKNEYFPLLAKEYLCYKKFPTGWYSMALKYNNYEVVNDMYVLDESTPDQKVKFILEELKRIGSNDKDAYILSMTIKNQEFIKYFNKYNDYNEWITN